MNLRIFIERPVLSAVLSIVIVVVGIIGLFTLPVEQYPDIAPPTVQVYTAYDGASAETVQKSVIAPLEEAINGVEDMTYMTSSASNAGSAEITIYFKQGTNPDMAAVNVQNRVSKAAGQLPAEVTRVGVSVNKRQNGMLQIFTLHSPDSSLDENFLSNYININLKPAILRISGVGDVQVMGGVYSMRVWLKPDVMAQYKLIPSDVTAALASQNIEAATGSIGENSKEAKAYTMKYRGRLMTPEEFGEIVIRSTKNGEVLRLKEIANISLGQESYSYQGSFNGKPGVSCMVYQTAGSNATEINREIDAFLADASKRLPKGAEITQLMSTNEFLFASIHEVLKTLIEAILLVILVVYVFLQDIRSTLIPLVGIFVSLIGTFAFMALVGFSINLITLFALVLVIGTVVDDAIIVVEAVQSKFDSGYRSPYMASVDAMKGLSGAIVTTSLVFVAVSTAPGNSLYATDGIMNRVEERIQQIPQVKQVLKVTGWSMGGAGNSSGIFFVRLTPWDERPEEEDHVQAVIGQIYARTGDIKDATIFAMAPGMIPGYDMGNALDIQMQDKAGGDLTEFFSITRQFIDSLNQRPELAMAFSSFEINYPQWQVDVDAAKCLRAGIMPDEVLSTLGGYYGGSYVSNFNRFSRVYRVMVQADPNYRLDEASLNRHFVRLSNGEMAPLSQFVTLTKVYGAESLNRFNMYNSIALNAMPAEGYSSGEAIRAVQETAARVLPANYDFDFGGLAREESNQSNTTIVIFAICLLMVYLLLSALYESFFVPFAVLLSVPAGLMGSFLFAKLLGLENNIYLQTGLIMLIGLLAKTAILLTEYATERRRAGMSLTSAALIAAKDRLRPILMTALTMIFGMVPLMLASGVGANGNSSLGTGVVGGMLVGTLALLFIVPAMFIVFQAIQEKVRPIQFDATVADWQIKEEVEKADEERKQYLENKKK